MEANVKRAILLAKVNDKKENLMTLIHLNKFQNTNIIALSDEVIKTIDEHLLVRSLEEFQEKFECDFEDYDIECEREEKGENPQVHKFYEELLAINKSFNDTKDEYKVWYNKPQEIITQESQYPYFTKELYEIWLGVKLFFEQANDIKAELLISNVTFVGDEEQESISAEKLQLYLGTVNDKADNSKKIAYGILPDAPIKENQNNDVRERFKGNKKTNRKMLYSDVSNVLQVFEKWNVAIQHKYDVFGENIRNEEENV